MKQENLNSLKVGDKINSFYGNGDFCCEKEVLRITESSCFFMQNNREQRESWNTVNNNIKNGIYKLKK